MDKELNSHPFKSLYKIWWILTLKMHQKSSIHFVLKGYEMLLMFFKWHVIKRHIKIHISLHSLKSFEILDCMLFHVSIRSSECSNKQTDCQIQSCWYTFIISHMDKTELNRKTFSQILCNYHLSIYLISLSSVSRFFSSFMHILEGKYEFFE